MNTTRCAADHDMQAIRLLAITALGLGLCLTGCDQAPPRPNVLLVVVDTLRGDYCSCYGFPAETTPNMDALARQGARFANVYSPMPTTTPAHASLFTSRPPLVHGVFKNGHVLPSSASTLAEVLRKEGYETAAFVSAFPMKGRFGLAQGFDVYDDDFTGADSSFRAAGMFLPGDDGYYDRRASETTDKVLEWLRARKGDRPFFLLVHFYDPHFPYDPPDGYARAFLPDRPELSQKERIDGLYCGEVLFADSEIGRLVGELDAAVPGGDLLTVVTSDHGEGLLQHDWMGHGLLLYEEAVRIPLLIRWPGAVEAGSVIEEHAELTDVAPTILSLLGIDAEELEPLGRPLLAARTGEAPETGGRAIFLQRRRYEAEMDKGRVVKGDKFALIWRDWKYIEAAEEGTRELYDLESDPGELENLIDSNREKADEMARALESLADRYRALSTGEEQTISAEDAERLKALGYGR